MIGKKAVIRKCKSGDAEENKTWCLYSHENKLLGRHPSKESAQKQESAIEISKHSKHISKITNYLFLFE